jgi:hypothetical protein
VLVVDLTFDHVLEDLAARGADAADGRDDVRLQFGLQLRRPVGLVRLAGRDLVEEVAPAGAVDDLEAELTGLRELLFRGGELGLLHTGDLHDDLRVTAAGHAAFGNAELVDPALDRLDGLLEGELLEAAQGVRGHAQGHHGAVRARDHMLGGVFHHERLVELGRVFRLLERQDDRRGFIERRTAGRRGLRLHARFAREGVLEVAGEVLCLAAEGLGHVDLVLQVDAALQVEAEDELLAEDVRVPLGQV